MMLRNKTALPVLQKIYDESYLTCSTAVYYEGQVSRQAGAQFTNPDTLNPASR